MTPVDSIKDVIRYVVEITIKMKTIVRKPLMIKLIKLRLRNLNNFVGYLKLKLPLLKNSTDTIHSWNDKKCLDQKMNVIERLEFELAYLEVAVQHFSHYATGTPRYIDK